MWVIESFTDRLHKTDGVLSIGLNQVRKHTYRFTETELQAIQSWAKYKTGKITSVSIQQIDLTLKQLNYKGVMEPYPDYQHLHYNDDQLDLFLCPMDTNMMNLTDYSL